MQSSKIFFSIFFKIMIIFIFIKFPHVQCQFQVNDTLNAAHENDRREMVKIKEYLLQNTIRKSSHPKHYGRDGHFCREMCSFHG